MDLKGMEKNGQIYAVQSMGIWPFHCYRDALYASAIFCTLYFLSHGLDRTYLSQIMYVRYLALYKYYTFNQKAFLMIVFSI